jgi:hypothetical protein
MEKHQMRLLFALIAVPLAAAAQTAIPTDWPSGAESLSPEELHRRLVGKAFVAKPVTGPSVRTQYQESHAYINVGSISDSGPWRTEGSAVCNEWRNLRAACSEIRKVGDALYVKRANNGEVILLVPQ